MPIITPAFPSMCATHTVMPSTLRILQEEFGRADKIVQHIFAGSKTWDALFERHTFFTKDHKYYLSIVAACRTKAASAIFSGLVQSKVRWIVKHIDDGQTGIETARPYTEYFERVHRCKNEDEVEKVNQGNLDYVIPASEVPADGSTPANGEAHIIYTTTFYIGLLVPPGMFISCYLLHAQLTRLSEGARSLDISYPVGRFRDMIKESQLYDENTMSIKVVHTRKYVAPLTHT